MSLILKIFPNSFSGEFDMGRTRKLQTLDVSGCRELQRLLGLEHLTSLETLNARGCENLQSIPGLVKPRNIQTFDVNGCHERQNATRFGRFDIFGYARC